MMFEVYRLIWVEFHGIYLLDLTPNFREYFSDRLPMYSVTAYDGGDMWVLPIGKRIERNHFRVPFILMVAVIILILFIIYKIAQFVGMCGTVEERVQLNTTNNRQVSCFIISALRISMKKSSLHSACSRTDQRALVNEAMNSSLWQQWQWCFSSARTTVPLTVDDYPHQHRAARQTRTTRVVPIHPDSEQQEAREYTVSDSPWSDYRARFVPLHPRQPDAVQVCTTLSFCSYKLGNYKKKIY